MGEIQSPSSEDFMDNSKLETLTLGLNEAQQRLQHNNEELIKKHSELTDKTQELKEQESLVRSLNGLDEENEPQKNVKKEDSLRITMIDDNDKTESVQTSDEETEGRKEAEVATESENNESLVNESKSTPEQAAIDAFLRAKVLSEEIKNLKAEILTIGQGNEALSFDIAELKAEENVINQQIIAAKNKLKSLKGSYWGRVGAAARRINELNRRLEHETSIDLSISPKDETVRQASRKKYTPTGEQMLTKIDELKQARDNYRRQAENAIYEKQDPEINKLKEYITEYEKNLQALREGKTVERYQKVRQEAEMTATVESKTDQDISPNTNLIESSSMEQIEEAQLSDTEDINSRTMGLFNMEEIHEEEQIEQKEEHRGMLTKFLEEIKAKSEKINKRKIALVGLTVGLLATMFGGVKFGSNKSEFDKYPIGPSHIVKQPSNFVDKQPQAGYQLPVDVHITEQNSWSPYPHLEDKTIISQPIREHKERIDNKTITEHTTDGNIPITVNKNKIHETNSVNINHRQQSENSSAHHINPALREVALSEGKNLGVSKKRIENMLHNPMAYNDLENRANTYSTDAQKQLGRVFDNTRGMNTANPIQAAAHEWASSQVPDQANSL